METDNRAQIKDGTINLGGSVLRKGFGLFFLLVAGYTAWIGMVDGIQGAMAWATITGFGWHMTFLRHHISVSRQTGTVVREISSVYPVYRFEARLASIQGFAVARSISRRNQHGGKVYELVAIFDSGEQTKLMSGDNATLTRYGQKIAEMSGKPFSASP
ncbi:hypothetical protein NF212_22025 [Parasalinivibrio latis]|uniref:hypothetical protein n=1 Tax=Parasalinivibrio latis TaxID=2952610 RepID=UPI0030DED242